MTYKGSLYNNKLQPFSLIISSTGGCGGVVDGLVACYPFDDNAEDASGNGNHGTVNGAILTTDRFGNSNSAYLFDGINDYIYIKNSETLNPKQITISAWYFATGSFSGNGTNVITHKPYTSHREPYYQWHLGIRGDRYNGSGVFAFDGRIAIPFSSSSVLWLVPEGLEITVGQKEMSTTEVIGKWNHLTTSFDGIALKLYKF